MLFKQNQVEAIGALTKTYEQLEQALTHETVKAAELREAMTAAADRLSDALADEAVAGATGAVAKTQAQVTKSRAEVQQQDARLAALRARLWDTGTNIANEARAMYGNLLDDERDAALKSFPAEWKRAAELWQVALGRRATLETLLGTRLRYPEPQPSPNVDVADLLPGHSQIANLFQGALLAASRIDPPNPTAEETSRRNAFHSALETLTSAKTKRARANYAANEEAAQRERKAAGR